MAARQEADGAEPEELTYRLFRRRQRARLERVTHADAHMLSTLSSNRSACPSRASEHPLRRCRVRALIAGLSAVAPPLISEVTDGRDAQPRFLFSATVELFERYGFTRVRQVGKHAWIVSRTVEPA